MTAASMSFEIGHSAAVVVPAAHPPVDS